MWPIKNLPYLRYVLLAFNSQMRKKEKKLTEFSVSHDSPSPQRVNKSCARSAPRVIRQVQSPHSPFITLPCSKWNFLSSSSALRLLMGSSFRQQSRIWWQSSLDMVLLHQQSLSGTPVLCLLPIFCSLDYPHRVFFVNSIHSVCI